MPRVKIESTVPIERTLAQALMDDVMDAIVATLHIPSDDRNISFVTYESEMFRMKPPYQFFIEIALFFGRSSETKKLLYRAILDRLSEKHGIEGRSVMIFLNEQPRENWGLRGGISADDIDLGYRVDI
jgi:phenylpyruvate tautomerase PptA (4-oxalocrotonate tautomerase family)